MPYKELNYKEFCSIVAELTSRAKELDGFLGNGQYTWIIGYKCMEMLMSELTNVLFINFENVTIVDYPIEVNKYNPWMVKLMREV